MNNPRFLRIERLLGSEALPLLASSHVCIVGLGAVGSYAVEGLARSGVGEFTLVDFDTVGITNINRQLFALSSTVGQNKCDVAAQRIQDINPDCTVHPLPLFAHQDSFEQIFAGKPDILIDAIDSLNPKISLLEYAYKQNITSISSMGAALRRDPSKIHVSDLMDTKECPLARMVRNKIRRRGVGRGIHAVYSSEKVVYEYLEPDEEAFADHNEQIHDQGRVRRVLGSLPTVPGIFGLTIANKATEILLEMKQS